MSTDHAPENTGYTVTILDHEYKSPTVLFASNVVSSVRENTGYGARELGCEFPVHDQRGQLVAVVSYNGRIWDIDADRTELTPRLMGEHAAQTGGHRIAPVFNDVNKVDGGIDLLRTKAWYAGYDAATRANDNPELTTKFNQRAK